MDKGRKLTFLLNKEDFPTFFSSTTLEIDFQQATQPFLSRGFGVLKVNLFLHPEIP